ncbi:MAG TPA: hypothetical protein DDZ80_30050, partial [Cyanobacteria bacterium UBA8803]|nr:hypothetical protein [Cyanobacteria bacterium UBA8803]
WGKASLSYHYPLPITHYPLPITHYPLPITHYPLPITNHQSPITKKHLRNRYYCPEKALARTGSLDAYL